MESHYSLSISSYRVPTEQRLLRSRPVLLYRAVEARGGLGGHGPTIFGRSVHKGSRLFPLHYHLPNFQTFLRPCYRLVLPAAGDRPAGGGGAKSEFTALIRLAAGLQMIQEETLPMVMFFIRLQEQLKNYRVWNTFKLRLKIHTKIYFSIGDSCKIILPRKRKKSEY